jgi:hypothetical protein
MAFLTQKKAELCKNVIITFVFEKNGFFSPKNCRKLQKIVSITSIAALSQVRNDLARTNYSCLLDIKACRNWTPLDIRNRQKNTQTPSFAVTYATINRTKYVR